MFAELPGTSLAHADAVVPDMNCTHFPARLLSRLEFLEHAILKSKIQPGPVCQGWACDSGSDRSALHVVGPGEVVSDGSDLSVPPLRRNFARCLARAGTVWGPSGVPGCHRSGPGRDHQPTLYRPTLQKGAGCIGGTRVW